MKPQATILHGDRTLLLSDDLVTRSDGLDQLTQEWISNNANLFRPNDRVQGYAGMRIKEVSRSRDRGDYRYRITATGLQVAERREEGYPKISVAVDGLDEASDSILTTRDSTPFRLNSRLKGYSTMYCIGYSKEPMRDGVWRFQGRYIGIADSGKRYKRRISVNDQEINLDSVRVLPPLHGGWSEYAPGKISFPKIVVQDYVAQIGGPPTEIIPGNLTPPNPPQIQNLPWDGDSVTKTWPNGWVLKSIDGEYVPGTQVWAGSLTYEYVWASLPR